MSRMKAGMPHKRTSFRKGAGLALFVAALLLFMLIPSVHGQENGENLALNKPVSVTTFCNSCGTFGTNAVDGDYETFWRALSRDEAPAITVDLGEGVEWNKVVMTLNEHVIDGYTLAYSFDGQQWTDVYVLPYSPQGSLETIVIEPVSARYVRVGIDTTRPANALIYELEVYLTDEEPTGPPPSVLTEITLHDGEREYGYREDLLLEIGDTHQIEVTAMMSDGSEADLSEAIVSFQSSDETIFQVNDAGEIIVVGDGVGKLFVTVELGPSKLATEIFVVVEDLAERAIWEATWAHPTIVSRIGHPAVMQLGEAFPALQVKAYTDLAVTGDLVDSDGHVVWTLSEQFGQGDEAEIAIPGHASAAGTYQLRTVLTPAGKAPVQDALYFTVRDLNNAESGQSQVAYVGEDGHLQYVPDYKGNTVLDFSNSGYRGGGVQIPDVQARIVVEPGEGDDTKRIQDAIDQVSRLPLLEDGFRGAVVLERGTFEVAGTLRIETDGVVLRGKGAGEDGTILYASGTSRRDILQIRGTGGPVIDESSKVEITELYVPVGARTFQVADASGFEVGDAIIVRRHGNDHWIHAIHMDTIVEREDTVQWTPFSLDFDRVITAIDGNKITVDAPIANAIERKWGGGEIYRYSDPGRIENVGVENLRVKVEFDPSVTMVYSGEEYYADENKARTFVSLANVKNAWVREIDAYHLEFSLAVVQPSAKWVTVQDARALEPVSQITGSRRYAFNLNGQLSLVQRAFAEKNRHAYVVGARVPGPNVFHDSESVLDYAYSEPHHRWSVGGLYDNISGEIALMDRGLYGTGHGWAGANYVAWNTEGVLIAQSPPTAQNYAIGHVGERRPGNWPNPDDPRPREDAFWDSHGQHVTPQSLYLQQLRDRLGEQAVQNIARKPVGGPELDTPDLSCLPSLQAIYVNGAPLEGFDPERFVYHYDVPLGMEDPPYVAAESEYAFEIVQAESMAEPAVIRVRHDEIDNLELEYVVTFAHTDLPDNLQFYTAAGVTASADDGNVPENTLDGDLSTRWSAEGEQWIEYDLGEVKPVSAVLLAFYNGDQRRARFNLELSADGTEWVRVFDGESSGNTLQLEMFTFAETAARYIRFNGSGNSVNAWNSITEAQFARHILEPAAVQMNGHVDVPDQHPNKVHVQSSWMRDEDGNLSGEGHLHLTPRGIKFDLISMDWLVETSDAVTVQWKGEDNRGTTIHTIRIHFVKSHSGSGAEAASIFIWHRNAAVGEPQIALQHVPFQGNIQWQ